MGVRLHFLGSWSTSVPQNCLQGQNQPVSWLLLARFCSQRPAGLACCGQSDIVRRIRAKTRPLKGLCCIFSRSDDLEDLRFSALQALTWLPASFTTSGGCRRHLELHNPKM